MDADAIRDFLRMFLKTRSPFQSWMHDIQTREKLAGGSGVKIKLVKRRRVATGKRPQGMLAQARFSNEFFSSPCF